MDICSKNSDLNITPITENSFSISFEEKTIDLPELFHEQEEILKENKTERLQKLKEEIINSIKNLALIDFTTNVNEYRIKEKSNYRKFIENSYHLQKINELIGINNSLSEILADSVEAITKINKIFNPLLESLDGRYLSREIYDLTIKEENKGNDFILFDENRIHRKDEEYIEKQKLLNGKINYYKQREIELNNFQKLLNSDFEKLQGKKYSCEDFLDFFDQYKILNAKYKLIENRLNILKNLKPSFAYSNLTIEILNDDVSATLKDIVIFECSSQFQKISQSLLEDISIINDLFIFLKEDSLIFEEQLNKKIQILNGYLNKYNFKPYFKNLIDK